MAAGRYQPGSERVTEDHRLAPRAAAAQVPRGLWAPIGMPARASAIGVAARIVPGRDDRKPAARGSTRFERAARKCPRCGSRRVTLLFDVPSQPATMRVLYGVPKTKPAFGQLFEKIGAPERMKLGTAMLL